jgi:hypothetical protein
VTRLDFIKPRDVLCSIALIHKAPTPPGIAGIPMRPEDD